MTTGILHTHYLVVTLFLLLYVIKTILLLSDKNELLAKFSKKTRVFEIVVSFLFLFTGIYLTTQLPFGGKFDYLFYIKVTLVFASIPIAVIGFRKSNKVMAALSLLMITGAFGLGEVYHKRKGIAKDTGVTIAATDGKSLYEANCSSCHGGDGKKGLGGAKDLTATAMDVAAIKEIILHGKNAMPAAPVKDVEAGSIAEYVNNELKGH